MSENLLKTINTPDDLRRLSIEQLPQVCDELRQYLIEQLSVNPGHLGSNLGVVELTVALHYVFNTPYDRLIWDVGHQAYSHKILTGRREAFRTNRQFKGLCGFPNPNESEFDAFGTGHSSTSISAALGMAIAANLKHENRQVVAIIGDGSMTGGLAFEGLNNATINPNNLLIILNDNNMAIDPIRGGLSQFLTGIHLSPTYNKVRYHIYRILRHLGVMNDGNKSRSIRLGNSLKSLHYASAQNNIFEGLNIRYFGPIDGHDTKQLTNALTELKNHRGPKVLHIITKKGKGYAPAEAEVTTFHAPGEFEPETGKRIKKSNGEEPPRFQDVFGNTLLELALQNDKIVGITPAMASGCSMNIMMDALPQRTFDVGIAEAHAVTFSAGLAKEGLSPYCNIYSSFMQRAYDNVIHDVALQKLNVTFCLDRAGIVGNDGATHQGQFDIAMFRPIPNITIAVPRNEHILRNLMFTAQARPCGPFIIRYPRGRGVLIDWKNKMEQMPIGRGERIIEGKDYAIAGIGPILYPAQKAIEQIKEQHADIAISLYDMIFAKPLDNELLHEITARHTTIFSIEDGTIIGGLGTAIEEWCCSQGLQRQIIRLGLPDSFVEHGSIPELFHMLSLDAEGIRQHLEKHIFQ